MSDENTPPKREALIQASGIQQDFTVGQESFTVLKKADFAIRSQTFNIVYGQSGSGKSTLLNILTGLQKPSKGQVLFEGQNVYELPPDELAHFRANQIGIVYQQNFWVKSLNVIENVSMPLYFLGYSKSAASKKAYAALERINMHSYGKKYPVLLSGGEQQRIAVARAIVNEPMFIIADEPTGSLDSTTGDMIMNLLHEAQMKTGRTIILVTHNMEYLSLADHLLHIKDGEVQEITDTGIDEAAEALIKNMKERITRLAKIKKDKNNAKAD